MKKGCLIAIAVVLVVLLLGVLGILYAIGVFPVAERIPMTQGLKNDTVVAAYMDLRDPHLQELSKSTLKDAGPLGWLAGLTMPHEMGGFLDLAPNGNEATFRVALSLRRFQPLIKNIVVQMAADPEFQGGEDLAFDENGLLVVSNTQPVPEDMAAVARERWGEQHPVVLTLEGGHFFELAADNRDGRAFLAFQSAPKAEDYGDSEPYGADLYDSDLSSEQPSGSEPETDEHEKQDIFNAEHLAGLFYRVHTARVTADFESADELIVNVDVDCPDEQAAQVMFFALLSVRDGAFRQAIEEGVVIEGEPYIDGTRVLGQLRVTGFRETLQRKMEEALAEAEAEMQAEEASQ